MSCVLHPHQDAVIVCTWDAYNHGVQSDFCADCIEEGRYTDNFGRCYLCKDGDHAHCIGVPCQCDCEGPTDQGKLDNQIADLEDRIARLKNLRSGAGAR